MERYLRLQQAQLNRAAKFTVLPGCDQAVVLFDAVPDAEEVRVRGRLDDVKVLVHESIAPLVAGADRPDRPDLIGSAAHRFLDVRIGYIARVDVRVAGDFDGREPDRQRHRGNEMVLGHTVVGHHLELLLGKLEAVNGPDRPWAKGGPSD